MDKFRCVAVAGVLMLLAACAGTAPKATNQRAQPAMPLVDASDRVSISVDAGPGVTLLDYEKVRLVDQLRNAIDSKKVQNQATASARDLEVKLTVTRYQKGNAFARAMLAGLGQIHLNGHILLLDAGTHGTVNEFDMAKTFAWGGIYGSSTSIEDIERTFAEGVAESLTGVLPPGKTPNKPKT